MPSEASRAGTGKVTPKLTPQQVCFVVEDVQAAVTECEEHFAWGPFFVFQAPVARASYKDWSGEKLVDVALGMAGQVQLEFLHIHKGRDTTADYQTRYGSGFQHLGILCQSRDHALVHLESLGARVNELNEYPGVRFAFVDVPTGPGMFEILQPTEAMAANKELSSSGQRGVDSDALFGIDRATVVTANIDQALEFYAAVFGWSAAASSKATLCINSRQTVMKRYLGKAGMLELELIEPGNSDDTPYSAHLQRGDHGLVHAGGALRDGFPPGATLTGTWLETSEAFELYDWAGGSNALQIRHAQ